MSVNKVIIVGRVGRDPETRYFPDGTAVSHISIATSETWKDKNGEKQERTEWHQVAFFGKLAEIVTEYVRKGSLLYVSGKIRTRKWQDKNGQDRYATEIVAEEMRILVSQRSEGEGASSGRPAPAAETPAPSPGTGGGSIHEMEEDIPF